MVKLCAKRLWIVNFLLLFLLTACGLNTSGEPRIVQEREIQSNPTSPPPTATAAEQAPAADATESVAAEPDTAVPAPGAVTELETEADPEPGAAEPAADTGSDVVVLSEPYAAADYDLGMQTYLAECASCHGAANGVGPSLAVIQDEAATRVAGMTAEEYVVQSIVEPSAHVVAGYDDVMPKDFAAQLSDAQIAGLVRFIFEFVPPGMANQTEADADTGGSTGGEAAAVDTDEVLAVTGDLIKGTADGDPIPADQPVSLYVLDGTGQQILLRDGTAQEDGTFRFEDIPRSSSYIYIIWVDYDGIPQGAQIHPIEGTEDEISADVTLYERTADHSTVGVTSAQTLLNFAPINEFGLEVRLDVELVNTGDRIVANENVGDEPLPVSVEIELPVGAFGIQPMQTQENSRYTVDIVDNVPIVQDTWPLRPNQIHKITIFYYLPYENGAVIEHAFGFPVMDATVLVPNDTVDFSSEQFDDDGAFRYRVQEGGLRVVELEPGEDVSDDDITLVRAYDLASPLSQDARMSFTLEGRPTRTVDVMSQSSAAAAQDDDSVLDMLPYFLAGLGMAVIGMAAVLWWRQRGVAPAAAPAGGARRAPAETWRPPAVNATKDELLQALAALEDAHDAGAIDEDTYHERRMLLLDRLLPLMDDDDA